VRAGAFKKSDVGAAQQRDPKEYSRQAAQGYLSGPVMPNINKAEY